MARVVVNILVAGLLLALLWVYLELVVWRGIRQHVRLTWLRPIPVRRAIRSERRRAAAFDRELRRFLEERAMSEASKE